MIFINARRSLVGESTEKFLFVHTVLERLAPIDKDDRNLVIVLTAEFGIRVDINFVPVKTAAFMEFHEALLDDFAEMTTLAGIDDDVPALHGKRSLAG